MISETSLVTNIEEKNTENTRNSDSPAMERMLPASPSSGRKMFSFLKPSSTVSIINSVPSVRQSISDSSSHDGGVIISAAIAARTDTVSIGSLFKNDNTFIFFTLTMITESADFVHRKINAVLLSI